MQERKTQPDPLPDPEVSLGQPIPLAERRRVERSFDHDENTTTVYTDWAAI